MTREWVFNDNYVVIDRNKRALFFLLLSSVFFYWGYQRGHEAMQPIETFVTTDQLLYQSLQYLYAKKYPAARELCQRVLDREPHNAEAMYQLGATEYLMKNIDQGRKLWKQAVQTDPHCSKAPHLKSLVLRDKAPELPDPGFDLP